MNKKIKKTLIVAVAVAFVMAPILIAQKGPKGPTGPAGKSNTAHLYLIEKNPSDWQPVIPVTSWGKMKYNKSGSMFKFVFNGHGLLPTEDYLLIYYPDPWPGNGLIVLGEGMADLEGDVHISNVLELNTDLPAAGDENLGAKIWLVLYDDVDQVLKKMIGWNPTDYLFEYDLITFDDKDV
jgi:hypothetical protein